MTKKNNNTKMQASDKARQTAWLAVNQQRIMDEKMSYLTAFKAMQSDVRNWDGSPKLSTFRVTANILGIVFAVERTPGSNGFSKLASKYKAVEDRVTELERLHKALIGVLGSLQDRLGKLEAFVGSFEDKTTQTSQNSAE